MSEGGGSVLNLLPSSRPRNPDLLREMAGGDPLPAGEGEGSDPAVEPRPKKAPPKVRKEAAPLPVALAVKNRRPVTSEDAVRVGQSRLAIYLTPEEHWKIRDAAHAQRVTIQDYCRSVLLAAVGDGE